MSKRQLNQSLIQASRRAANAAKTNRDTAVAAAEELRARKCREALGTCDAAIRAAVQAKEVAYDAAAEKCADVQSAAAIKHKQARAVRLLIMRTFDESGDEAEAIAQLTALAERDETK